MFIPHRVVQILHEERIQELLNDAKLRRGYLPHDEGIHIIAPAKNKWRIRLATIPTFFSHLNRILKWRIVFQPTDTHLACETLCED
jgi:hypothetical protein